MTTEERAKAHLRKQLEMEQELLIDNMLTASDKAARDKLKARLVELAAELRRLT